MSRKMTRKRKLFAKIISPAAFLLIWYALAFFIDASLILPYPHRVIIRLFELIQTSTFWLALLFTMLRVFAAFIISFILGFFLGLISADCECFKNFMIFPLGLIRATPIIAFILLALFWFQSGTVPIFVAVLMSLPVMITASQNGFEKTPENQEKLFKAACSGFTGCKAFRYIRLPGAKASLMSGAESSFGLCWKVVAAGEVLSIPHHATGTLMQKAQIHLETPDVLALTIALVLMSMVSIRLFRSLLNQRKSGKCVC